MSKPIFSEKIRKPSSICRLLILAEKVVKVNLYLLIMRRRKKAAKPVLILSGKQTYNKYESRSKCFIYLKAIPSRKHTYIILTPLKPHFYIVKLGFTGVYIIFLIFAQNTECGYSLEPPRRGGSNEYPQSMF